MMPAKQAAFRENYKSQINPAYNGPAHVAAIFIIGLVGIWYFARHLHHPTWEWLMVIPIFLADNIFEWVLHTYVMHRPVKWLRGIYNRHTLNHHQYFTHHVMTVDSNREFRIIFFPPYALAAFIGLSIPPALLIGYLWSTNVAWILMLTNTVYYLVYETFHYCCHVEENAFVRYCPFINTIRRHHTAHHNQSIMMTRNMNLTFPVADWLFGTSDLNRSLLGTLFNGYNDDHIKPEVRDTITKHAMQGE